MPFEEAPDLFGECQDIKGYSHCFVKRQPEKPSELANMVSAIQYADLECIRYRGDDHRIQLELVDAGCGHVCDKLSDDLKVRMDEVAADQKRRYEEQQAERDATTEKAKHWWKFWLKNS